MADERALRHCDECRGVDDHPRHVIHADGGADGKGLSGRTPSDVKTQILRQASQDGNVTESLVVGLDDDTTIYRHMDCCREAGCPDGSCNEVTAGAETKRGDDLVKHLTKGTRRR